MPQDISYKTNEIKRSYYLNLFSGNAQIKLSADGNKNAEFTWNIRNLQLGSIAEIALIQMTHNGGSDNTTYCIRCTETYQDGFDSYNHTSAVLYLGSGLHTINTPTYHKLISNNLNSITLIFTDDITLPTKIYGGINKNVSFGLILHVVDYVDNLQKF